MKSSEKSYIFIILIIALGAFIRFWGLSGNDITSDLAINAFRSYGWLDFLTKEQTSPIVWFGFRPWWSLLSFHDMPPLVMAIQHVFMRIFGLSTVAVLLPFLLSSILVIYFLYYFLSRLVHQTIALLASFIFAMSSYSIWAARTGYLEGVEVLFIVLSIFFFWVFITHRKNKYVYLFSVFAALSLLSKYTAVFILLSIFLYLILFERKIFKNKHFYISILSALIILSPVIIYNIFVFKTRGHFDAALSAALGIHSADFGSLADRGVSNSIFGNILSLAKVLYQSMSLPLLLLYGLAVAYLFFKAIMRRARPWQYLMAISILMICLMFIFVGPVPRMLSIINPFLAIVAAWFVYRLYFVLIQKKVYKQLLLVILLLVAGWEIFYAINTNILSRPIGAQDYAYSRHRFYNKGFVELGEFIDEAYPYPEKKSIKNYADLEEFKVDKDFVVFIDDRMSWFSRIWYINRYSTYYQAPFFYFVDINNIVKSVGEENGFSFFANKGINNFVFIYVTEEGDSHIEGLGEGYAQNMDTLKDGLESTGVRPIQEIKDYKGDIVFKIYYFSM